MEGSAFLPTNVAVDLLSLDLAARRGKSPTSAPKNQTRLWGDYVFIPGTQLVLQQLCGKDGCSHYDVTLKVSKDPSWEF